MSIIQCIQMIKSLKIHGIIIRQIICKELRHVKLKHVILVLLVALVFYLIHSYENDPLMFVEGGEMDALAKELLLARKNNSLFNPSQQSLCKLYPSTLVGVRKVYPHGHLSLREVQISNPHVQFGGKWKPTSCSAQQKVAIIIPYRDRWQHLSLLLKYLHTIMMNQQLDYQVIVVEQAGTKAFNKGRIMNVAFDEGLKLEKFDCFIFHDVDLIPENDYNLYSCGEQPRHLSPAVDEMRYTLMYKRLVGGVLALSRAHFIQVNGFSNLYWGWGGEDDDMSKRIVDAGLIITRPRLHVGRYKMVPHVKRTRSEIRMNLLARWRRWRRDGLNMLPKLDYSVLAVKQHDLYLNITVDVGDPPSTKEQLSNLGYTESFSWSWSW